MVSLPEDSQEYKAVEEKFLRTLSGKVVISKIERIQNPSMFNSYMLRKQSMDEKDGTIDNELELFHGTRPESVKEINVQGFNRSLCGVHGMCRSLRIIEMFVISINQSLRGECNAWILLYLIFNCIPWTSGQFCRSTYAFKRSINQSLESLFSFPNLTCTSHLYE